MKNKNKVLVHFLIDKDFADAIKDYAKTEGKNRSKFISDIITNEIIKRSD